MSIRPLADRLAVKREQVKEKSPGGILLPDQARSKADRGRVVAVGSGLQLQSLAKPVPLDIKVGDTVLFWDHAGVDVEVNGEELTILGYGELLAVL